MAKTVVGCGLQKYIAVRKKVKSHRKILQKYARRYSTVCNYCVEYFEI